VVVYRIFTVNNSTYKKLAVQWLNEALCPAWRDFVVASIFALLNRQLLVAANRLRNSVTDDSANIDTTTIYKKR